MYMSYELYNYMNYKKLLKYVEGEKDYDVNIDHKWMENFWLEDLSNVELVTWIKNTISYSYSGDGQKDRKYYKDVPFELIPRDKMLKWTCYHLYFKSMDALDPLQKSNSYNILDKIEKKINFKFLEADGSDIYFLRFGYNKIETTYTPVIFYSGLNVLKNVAYTYLRYNGFKKYETINSKMIYFHYSNNKNKKTTIFIHGLGIGITPYIGFIMSLIEDTNLIVPVLPNISNMEFHGLFETITENKLFPSYEIWRDDFKGILINHNIDNVNVIGHSFGTIIMGILLKDDWIKEKIDKKIFIDPVCFIDECYKILRYINEPDFRGGGVVNNVFNMLVYKDVYVRYATQRFLYGPEFWIFDYDELNNDNNLIILSTDDKMVPSSSIYRRMRKHNIPCIVVNNAQHADIFTMDQFRDVLNKIKIHIVTHLNSEFSPEVHK